MHALQQRLEFASIKTSHGWADMSIGEIETVCSVIFLQIGADMT